MIDHARHCTGFPCTCKMPVISLRDGNRHTFRCGTCLRQMFREDGYFVHVENGAVYCPDTMEDEQWE